MMRDSTALEQAEAAFEFIRLNLIDCLDEPHRLAFWKAVEGREGIRAALLRAPAQAASNPSSKEMLELADQIDYCPDNRTEEYLLFQFDKKQRELLASALRVAAQPPAAPVERSAPAAPTGDTRSGERPPASAAMGHSAGADTRCSAGTEYASLEEQKAWADELQEILDTGEIPDDEMRKASTVLALLRSCEHPNAAAVCAELYQVIGYIAYHYDVMEHPDIQKALDNASRIDLVHKDLLPWPKQDLPTPPQTAPNRDVITRIINGIYGIGSGTYAGGHQDKSIARAVDAILAAVKS